MTGTELKNRHESDEARAIAEANTVLRTQVGSGLHGVTIEGTDDRDEMGVCIEPPEYVIGLKRFEQYQWRTQPEGVRSGAGDLDLVIYSLRKWAGLAAQGNPTVLMLLFVPEVEIVSIDWPGRELQQNPDMFLSKDCGRRFIGYLDAQRDRMLGLRSQRTNRPELVDVYGFDTKFAYHAVRLGLQGCELLTTGRINLPMLAPHRHWLRDLRLGLHTKDEALERINDLRDDLVRCTDSADLPDKPDYDRLNAWLIATYEHWWFSGPSVSSVVQPTKNGDEEE